MTRIAHRRFPLRRALAAAALLTLGAVPARAQARYGHTLLLLEVRDDSGKPIPAAFVTVAGADYGAMTNTHGEARVESIAEGNRLITVTRQGFAMARVAADFTGARDTVRREVRMTAQPVELEGVTATSWGRSMRLRQNGFYHRMRMGLGAYMTRDRIDQLQPLETKDLFRYMRGFMVVHTGRGWGSMVVATRGSVSFRPGQCVPLVYIDGMLTSNSALDQGSILELVPPQDLEAVEAYAGISEIPAEYNPTGSACGVILLWTRDGSR